MTTSITFADLDLIEPIKCAVAAKGYRVPTSIQAQAIPHLLQGKDLLGCARTGTGKTAAFALPLLDRLSRNARPAGAHRPRVLVLAPTRELAQQIGESFATYGQNLRVTCTVVTGGVGQGPQVAAIRKGAEIVVATPGRLIDLMQQRHIQLDAIEALVLDEADRMLDMGFIPDIRRIVSVLPRKRQNLLFSATMPPDIAELASRMLVDPVKVSVDPPATTVEKVAQWVLFVERDRKAPLLGEVLRDPAMTRVLVFTRTKHGANKVAAQIGRGGVRAEVIHGNRSQNARQRALDGFRDGRVRVLVATDLASRGIDVAGITHVINFELPNIPESYVHRIGRTARAGAAGIALSFCATDERAHLRDIERLTRTKLKVVDRHPYAAGPATGAMSAYERNPGASWPLRATYSR